MIQRVLGCLALLLSLGSPALACTLTWSPVTTTTDGTAAAGIKYKLYFIPTGSTVEQVVADTDQTTVTLLCPAGTYTASAYNVTAAESDRSNSVVLKQMTRPMGLNWTR